VSEVTDLNVALNTLIGAYSLTRDQLSEVAGGPADGGPSGTGFYPWTQPDGTTLQMPSIAKLLAMTAGLRGLVKQSWSELDAVAEDAEVGAIAQVDAGDTGEHAEAGVEGDVPNSGYYELVQVDDDPKYWKRTGNLIIVDIAGQVAAAEAAAISSETEPNSIYTPATRAANAGDINFRTYFDRFYGLEITVPVDINGGAPPRLFVTRIGVRSSASGDANIVGLTISQLKTDNSYQPVAQAYNWGDAYSYYDGATFVHSPITGVGAFAGAISGKIRMDRTTAWNYFFAGAVNATQIARVYSDAAPGTGGFEIDPAYINAVDLAVVYPQPAWSVFAATAYAQKVSDAFFRTRLDTFFDMHIEVANALDAYAYKRLFITAVASELSVANLPVVKFSVLNDSNEFVLVATGRGVANSVNTSQFDGNNQFVEYALEPEVGFEGKVSGRFKWLRAAGWNYFYNAGTPKTWNVPEEDDDPPAPALGALEISQDCIVYLGDNQILPDAPSYPGILERLPTFTDRFMKAEQDVTVVVNGDSIATANNYASDRADASTRPPLCHEHTMFSNVEEALRWKGQQYRRFDVPGIFTEAAEDADTAEYDAAWDWQAPTALVPSLGANYKPAITRILGGADASVSYVFPAGMRRCDFIYRTDYLCAATTGVAIAEGNGKVVAYDEETDAWVEANGYTFSAQEDDTVLEYDIVDPYGDSPNQPLRRSMYQKRLKMRSSTALTSKTVTIANSGTGRLNYWGIEFSPRPVMSRFINSARGGHTISRIRAFEEWEIDYWKPDLICLNSQIINEGARSVLNMPATNTPPMFAARFSAYVELLQGKEYAPDILASTRFVGQVAELVDQTTGDYNVGSVIGYGPADVFNYIGHLDRAYQALGVPHINMFYTFLNIAEKIAAARGTNNIYTSAIAGSGITGSSLTFEGTHPNDYAGRVGTVRMLPVFDGLC
jgi:hypothetical protein